MEASTQAREQQAEARLAHDQKCQDAADAETANTDAIENSLENTEALEKHVKTVTMRAESSGEHGSRFLQKHFSTVKRTRRGT